MADKPTFKELEQRVKALRERLRNASGRRRHCARVRISTRRWLRGFLRKYFIRIRIQFTSPATKSMPAI